jgi:CHASE1-domain containing sensor protein
VALRREIPALTLWFLGAAVSVFWFALDHVRTAARERAELQQKAQGVAADLRSRLGQPVEVLRSIDSLFAASEDVSRAEFRSFVAGALEHNPGIRALEWIPIVPAAERGAFEARARAEGFAGFHFKEEGPDLALIAAGERAEYLPIYYMEPPDPAVLGFDVAANRFRRGPADRARELGQAIASERLRLVEDPPEVYSIAVFYPVNTDGRRPGAARGFAAEVFRIETWIRPVVEALLLEGNELGLADAAASHERRVLFESRRGLLAAAGDDPTNAYSARFPVADRSWSLTLVAGPARLAGMAAWSWSILVAGLVMSGLLAATLSGSLKIYRLQREVHAALKLGQYTLLEKLGEGGMGVVYRARHGMLRRDTAVKLLPPGKRAAADIARFEREVQLTSQLTHPNTIAIYDYGRTPEGIFYYAMEYIDGVTLEDLVTEDGPLPAPRVVHALVQIAGALAEAHSRAIVHRDVKPSNLMLTERGGIPDFVTILDFGLVKPVAANDSLSLTRGSPLLGTPLYLSPEAILTGVVDGRSDIYALGAVAYFLLTGKNVFEGSTIVEICSQHVSEAPIPPSRRAGISIPPSLERVVLRCLAKAPEDRFPSSSALLDELRQIEAELGPFDAAEARRWWQGRGRALQTELRARRAKHLRSGDTRVAVAFDSSRAAPFADTAVP